MVGMRIGRPPKIVDVDRFLTLAALGWSDERLAVEFGVTSTTARNYRRRLMETPRADGTVTVAPNVDTDSEESTHKETQNDNL
jgi:hypothetical protein